MNDQFTDEARALLEEWGAEWPQDVDGTGENGQVTLRDVQLLLGLETVVEK